VASGGSSLDELQSSTNVSFDAANYAFHEEDHSTFGRNGGGQGRNSNKQISGLFSAPTQAFAALLEGGDTAPKKAGTDGEDGPAPFAGLVSKAISVYEKNANIISGNSNILGTSLSVVL